ncbi:unnamed protein product [Adineta steineri]|uniref:Uncharacterized protein n=1 Tax=Adineta steineri TaxID=433720 RepID=A0A815PKI1_9BILA|nr:unnamed protein product [Adineta steineri]CAF3522381.1 unnamed protein product [Adineta steineri]
MATTTGKAHCITCGKEKTAYKCEGCSQHFCANHLAEHQQTLRKQLDEVEDRQNLFKEAFNQEKMSPQKHSLMQLVNKWEQQSIKTIQQTAEEARQLLIQHTTEYINQTEVKLTKFTKQLRQIREENNVNENIVNQFKQKIKELEVELGRLSNISIQEDSSLFIPKISIVISSASLSISNVPSDAKWQQNGIIVAGGIGVGNGLNQLSNPYGVYVDHDDQTIYVAEYANHRIVEWKKGAKNGQVVAGGNGPGNQNNQLNRPRNVIVDKKNDCFIISDYGNKRVVRWPRRNGTSGETIILNIACWDLVLDNDDYLYVSDISKHEVTRWKIGDRHGTLVAGGNGNGNRLDQLNRPYYIFVDQDHSVYVSDCENHRVMKWLKGAKEGIVVAGRQGEGNSLTQLSRPYGIIVDQLGTIYVADCGNHRIMRYLDGTTKGNVIIGENNGQREQASQLSHPVDVSFDQQGNLYVADNDNYRVQKFEID